MHHDSWNRERAVTLSILAMSRLGEVSCVESHQAAGSWRSSVNAETFSLATNCPWITKTFDFSNHNHAAFLQHFRPPSIRTLRLRWRGRRESDSQGVLPPNRCTHAVVSTKTSLLSHRLNHHHDSSPLSSFTPLSSPTFSKVSQRLTKTRQPDETPKSHVCKIRTRI